MSDAINRIGEDELDEIRERTPVSEIFNRFSVRLRRAGAEFVCLCPFHSEKTPSCSVSDKKMFFHCHGCGAHGDVIDAVMRFRGCTFPEAVEYLGGQKTLSDADRAKIEERRQARQKEERDERDRNRSKVERLWSRTSPIANTLGAEYLANRGLEPAPADLVDVRFISELVYYGFPDDQAESVVELGAFPAMCAAIRDPRGLVIGIHRTFIQPDGSGKLVPPGDRARNKSKKILGEHRGGVIWLSPRRERTAFAEGIETAWSWLALGGGGDEEIGVASAISLGNLSGGATGSVPHPTKKHSDGRPHMIPNGIPDLERPGLLPPPHVKSAVLLGDGDSDRPGTLARLLTAARRWRESGLELVSLSMAPDGSDWNDVLRRECGL